ncbi:unnamed protein product [Bemisia tabaci]|uniref:TRAF3-interacting protein 1 n=2 Tax=Bemisia tabaci TaxID=7038 RepID=A0A9P0F7W0_BEMTA|nr:unnamed protein product [Bemisia tabaci]
MLICFPVKMAEDVDPNLIIQTQNSLSKHIKKPPLLEKFLKKPPFRFLQDIVKSVIKETKFLDSKFSEKDFENAKDRDTKIKFLDTLIAEVEVMTGEKVKARPAKIVAGLDVNRTLELLTLLGKAIDKNSDTKNKQQNSEKTQNDNQTKVSETNKKNEKKDEEKKPRKKITSETESRDAHRKTADRTQATKDSKAVPKSGHRVENKDPKQSAVNRRTQNKPKEDDRKHSPTKTRPAEKPESRTKDSSPQVEPIRTDNRQNAEQTEETKVKNENVNGQNEEQNVSDTHGSKEKDNRKDKMNSKGEKVDANGVIQEKPQEAPTKKPETETKKAIDLVKEPKPLATNIREPKKMTENSRVMNTEPKPLAASTREPKKLAENSRVMNTLQKTGESVSKEAPDKVSEKRHSLERTDSGRVTSSIGQRQELNQRSESHIGARPVKLDANKRVFTPDKGARQRSETERPTNIFTESQDDKDDADDMFILETHYIAPTANQGAESKEEIQEQGQLVSQIIDTKKQLESKEGDAKTKIQWEESANWRRNTGEKEVGGVKTLIQELTKNAGPLGQLLAGLQEDVDEMMQELAHWREVNAQLAVDMKKEKEQTNDLIKPLLKQLEELEQVELPQEEERVRAAKMTVYMNDKKIEELLRSRTK